MNRGDHEKQQSAFSRSCPLLVLAAAEPNNMGFYEPRSAYRSNGCKTCLVIMMRDSSRRLSHIRKMDPSATRRAFAISYLRASESAFACQGRPGCCPSSLAARLQRCRMPQRTRSVGSPRRMHSLQHSWRYTASLARPCTRHLGTSELQRARFQIATSTMRIEHRQGLRLSLSAILMIDSSSLD